MTFDPSELVAYRLDGDGEDEVVVFVWEAAASPPVAAKDGLSPAEREVLALLLEGRSNAEIALARRGSVRTVANQVASILRKTGAASRFELMATRR